MLGRVVDLTHPISPFVPVWPDDPPPSLEPIATAWVCGYSLNMLTIGEHTGTHVGVAAHLHPDGFTIDRLTAEELIRPAVLFGISLNDDPDCRFIVADVLKWEATHGCVPAGCVALLRTGWDRRWATRSRSSTPTRPGPCTSPASASTPPVCCSTIAASSA